MHVVPNTVTVATGDKSEAWQINEGDSKANLAKVLVNKAIVCEGYSNICHLFILPEPAWMVLSFTNIH